MIDFDKSSLGVYGVKCSDDWVQVMCERLEQPKVIDINFFSWFLVSTLQQRDYSPWNLNMLDTVRVVSNRLETLVVELKLKVYK